MVVIKVDAGVVRKLIHLFPIPLFLSLLFFSASCDKEKNTNWSVYKSDPASSSYSPLTEINRDNVHLLKTAWIFDPDDAPAGTRTPKYECNPIVVDSILYATSARHWLYGIHAATGEKIWSFDPFDGKPGGGIKRGVAYWAEGDDRRILFTADHYLIAIDALTGKMIDDFGVQGRVDLNEGLGVNPDSVWVIPTSPGIVHKDLLILGGEVSEVHGAAPGHIRAFDVRTGETRWIFHTIPQPGETGYDTWPEGAWKRAGGANNWGGMSLDVDREIVFIPTGSPTYDFYGADRKGMNLFGNSIVALNANTGKLIWYYQTIHHDLWDYDLPAPPNLVRVRVDGKERDAIAQPSKVGFLYVLDRETGEPVWPIEERPVPASHIPGEQAWPTQPFPTKPAPYARQSLSEEELISGSTGKRDSLVKHFRSLRYEGLFTPPDPKGSLLMPGTRGGSEWGGAAYDPRTGILYLNSNESPEVATVQKVNVRMREEGMTFYRIGRELYNNHCATCHGDQRQGQEPNYPALLNLKQRISPELAWEKISKGSGRMPAFGSILQDQKEAILSYLFEIREGKPKPPSSPADTTTQYLNVTAYGHLGPSGQNPSITPPWGTLKAIDMNTGEYLWDLPLGTTVNAEGDTVATGTENWGGPSVSAGGLVFIGATRDQKFRAFDSSNGKLLWETSLPGYGYATPSIFSHRGKQFVVIAVTGDRQHPSGKIVAFSLPDDTR